MRQSVQLPSTRMSLRASFDSTNQPTSVFKDLRRSTMEQGLHPNPVESKFLR